MSAAREQSPVAMAEAKLVWRLRHGDVTERYAAVKELREVLGRRALEPLCEALEDPKVSVRIAAARELGALRDARAVEPLSEALRKSLAGGSISRHVRRSLFLGAALGLGWLVLCGTLGGATRDSWHAGFAAAVLVTFFFNVAVERLQRRRKEGWFSATVCLALAEIAEHQVTPEMHPLAKELRLLSRDRIQQDGQTREAVREAADRIRSATEKYHDLPVASSAAATASELELPRVADRPVPDLERLPRV